MSYCLLALGSNIGDSLAAVEHAVADIDGFSNASVVAKSSLYATPPIGGPSGQDEFVNAAAIVDTILSPPQLWGKLHETEQKFGRQRTERWAARTLDLDILLIDAQVLDSPDVIVPHPRMSFRPFVLDPAVEIAGDWHHPLLMTPLKDLRDQLDSGDDSILLYGGNGDDRRWHAERLAAEFDGLRVAEEHSTPGELFLIRTGDATASPKLAIQLREAAELPRPGLPTLAVPAESRESVVFDTVAAVECVWSDLGRRRPGA